MLFELTEVANPIRLRGDALRITVVQGRLRVYLQRDGLSLAFREFMLYPNEDFEIVIDNMVVELPISVSSS